MKKFTSQLTLSYSEIANRKRPRKNGKAQANYKRKIRNTEEYCCAVCGWKEPDFFAEIACHEYTLMVEAHHVLPARRTGNDTPDNFLLLCPIHHSYADFLAENSYRQIFKDAGLFDAHNKTSLIACLKALDKNPSAWWKKVKTAIDKAQGELTESLSKMLE